MSFTPYGLWRDRRDELMKQLPHSRIAAFLALPPDAPVRLYSRQGEEAWRLAEKRGYWTGEKEYIETDEHERLRPYAWMRDEMAARIPDFSGDYPMWAWLKRPSAKAKENSKKFTGTHEAIRLTVVVPRSRILISDFDNWHCVLNDNPLCKTEAEYDHYSDAFPQHWSTYTEEQRVAYFNAISPTWRGIFAFEPTRDRDIIRWSGSTKFFRVQACVDRFYWPEIVDVRRFID